MLSNARSSALPVPDEASDGLTLIIAGALSAAGVLAPGGAPGASDGAAGAVVDEYKLAGSRPSIR
jgi:hypothetical protein